MNPHHQFHGCIPALAALALFWGIVLALLLTFI